MARMLCSFLKFFLSALPTTEAHHKDDQDWGEAKGYVFSFLPANGRKDLQNSNKYYKYTYIICLEGSWYSWELEKKKEHFL